MDTYSDRRDTWRSVLLVAAAVGLAAGLYLVTYQTLHHQLAVTALGTGIAAASALSVFVRPQWVGGVVVALALTTTFLLLTADFFTVRAVVAAILAAVAGAVMLTVRRSRIE